MTGAPFTGNRAEKIPIFAVWQREVGPLLSLGMLTAAARSHLEGALNERFDIRRPEVAERVLAELGNHSGPAVLLCSDYVWSVDHNLATARAALERCGEVVVIHGGPSAPSYPEDARAFLERHGSAAAVLVRGEGEATLCKVLESLAATDGRPDDDRWREIEGLSFLDRMGGFVRTPDAARIIGLDALPSPYLTGEFDDIDPTAWHFGASIETNRGCPYGCTFCDWGSATLSRIRNFSLERVAAEIDWCVDHGVKDIQLCDANFGIKKRDIEVARHLADSHRATGIPRVVAFTPAKNTTKHLVTIFDELLEAGILLSTAISLQTTDPATLSLVNRSNISTDAYLALACDLRRRGQDLQGDLLLGLPGQTYESYREDLQFFMDHGIAPRTWSLRLLPNAPMNEPGYREAHQIRTNRNNLVIATATMTEAERSRALRLRKVQYIGWKFGVVRQLLTVMQWERGVPSTSALEVLADTTTDRPREFPVLAWTLENFDLWCVSGLSWSRFYKEACDLLTEAFDLRWDADLETALRLQQAIMPAPGRQLPVVVDLPHDFPAYLRDAATPLYRDGSAARPTQPLQAYGPVRLTVVRDPHGICAEGLHLRGDSRAEVIEGNFWIDIGFDFELPTDPPLHGVAPGYATPSDDLDLEDRLGR
jgi:radical SAM superfamily enzyme YgiQ (UPF0313 family)